MSYCRWSSDNFACDLYCYETGEGYVTHVAATRIVGEVPKLKPYPDCNPDHSPEWRDWMAAHKAQSEFVRAAEYQDIGGPHDGETLWDATLEDLRDRLLSLRSAGYHFPDSVLDAIEDEMREEAA